MNRNTPFRHADNDHCIDRENTTYQDLAGHRTPCNRNPANSAYLGSPKCLEIQSLSVQLGRSEFGLGRSSLSRWNAKCPFDVRLVGRPRSVAMPGCFNTLAPRFCREWRRT